MTNDSSLLAIERQRRILEILQREGSVRTAELTELMNVSAVTIRSDLRELEKAGDCQIIWGGAVSNRPPTEAESILEHRSELNSEAKKRIGKKAAGFVEVGQTIFVDAGTTTVEIIKHLPPNFDYLRVVTPALNVAVAATYHTYIELVMPGGILRNLTKSLIGAQTLRSLEIFNADVLFLASGGFSLKNGVTTGNLLEVEVKRTMVARAKKVVLVADSSKFGRTLSLNVAPINAIDTIITDHQLHDTDVQALQDAEVEVLRV